ncbi:MAG: pyrimidine dimer DNA glycosylase/endonuclease V [Coriobacteriia bacterium]
MIDPVLLCDRHLLGEHVECHMLAGSLARRRSIDGFIVKGLLEPESLVERHDALAGEMVSPTAPRCPMSIWRTCLPRQESAASTLTPPTPTCSPGARLALRVLGRERGAASCPRRSARR